MGGIRCADAWGISQKTLVLGFFWGKPDFFARLIKQPFEIFGFFKKTRRFCTLYLVHSEQGYSVLSAFSENMVWKEHERIVLF